MTTIQSLWAAIFASFAMTYACILLLKPIAEKVQLVDIPGGRKQHAQSTPLIGGVAMLMGFLMAMLLMPQSLLPFRGLIFGCTLLVFVGVLDDFHEISPRGRLGAQGLALCVMIFLSNVQLNYLGSLFGLGPIRMGWFTIPFTLFGAASLINSINIIDGQDGLSGGIVTISLSTLMLIAFWSGYPNLGMVLAVFIPALLAYLCFNFPLPWRPHASIFMGDAGTMLMGFILAWFTISLSQQDNTLAGPVHMLWIAAVPLMDLATVFIKRLRSKRSPFQAGPDHIYNVLQEHGFSKKATLFIILGLSLFTNIVVLLLIKFEIHQTWVLLGFLLMFVVYFLQCRPPRKPEKVEGYY